MSENDLWCDDNCYEDTWEEQNAYYVPDNSGRIVTDNEGNKYEIEKHHWRCDKCNKIVQIG